MPAAEFASLLSFLSVPRPNGSRALERTVEKVRTWLEEKGISVQPHRFTLHPYSMELLGLWMAFTGLLLPVAALGRWGWEGGLVLQPQITNLSFLATHQRAVFHTEPPPGRPK
jgi:hypothetical protein